MEVLFLDCQHKYHDCVSSAMRCFVPFACFHGSVVFNLEERVPWAKKRAPPIVGRGDGALSSLLTVTSSLIFRRRAASCCPRLDGSSSLSNRLTWSWIMFTARSTQPAVWKIGRYTCLMCVWDGRSFLRTVFLFLILYLSANYSFM